MPKRGSNTTADRDHSIYNEYMDGKSLKFLANKHNVSESRIRQITIAMKKSAPLMYEQKEPLYEKVTMVRIPGFGRLEVKASPDDIANFLKEKFSTNLDRLQDMINSGEIDEEKAQRVMLFLANQMFVRPPKEKIDTRTGKVVHQTLGTETEAALDRMEGVSFGGN